MLVIVGFGNVIRVLWYLVYLLVDCGVLINIGCGSKKEIVCCVICVRKKF